MLQTLINKLQDWLAPMDALNDRAELDIIPDGSAAIELVSGDGTWGDYVEIEDVSLYDYMLVGIYVFDLSIVAELGTVAIATGVSESEAVKVEIPVAEAGATNQSGNPYFKLPFPVPIVKGSRIAAKYVTTTNVATCNIKLNAERGIVDKLDS